MDNDDITINVGNIVIDLSTMDTTTIDTKVYTTNDWISIGSLTDDTIDLNNITICDPVEFEDRMPDVSKVEDMCNEYPALAKAYENFKTIYTMVHQDWVGKQKQDELPF